jgi:NAD(P)-dependent dehydrogenase (short-subunit alcohol dehydrogenase family)
VAFFREGTAGLGKQTILWLAKHQPKHIYFTGRNAKAAEAVVTEVKSFSSNLTFLACDQTSLGSVSKAMKELLKQSNDQMDMVICNAGIAAVPPGITQDGYEIQFGVNHLAHALMIKLLLPALHKASEERGDARIVLLSSLGFQRAKKEGIIFEDLKTSQANLGTNSRRCIRMVPRN